MKKKSYENYTHKVYNKLKLLAFRTTTTTKNPNIISPKTLRDITLNQRKQQGTAFPTPCFEIRNRNSLKQEFHYKNKLRKWFLFSLSIYMVLDVKDSCGDHFSIYTNTEPHGIPTTKIR